MDGPRLLSGGEMVARGVTNKIEGQLPESGLKAVSPTGSWLEQKQIQSALEARKHWIEVERIEKRGSLSHAIWRDDLNLAEVIQQTGSHWQYIGHNIGKHLYLQPEEALFLIEVNCLLLKHNDVTVSLQKAYSLCLGEISIAQYKVYASLSRLGYRVLRHKEPKSSNKGTKRSSDENKVSACGTSPHHTVSDNKTQQLDSIRNEERETGNAVTNTPSLIVQASGSIDDENQNKSIDCAVDQSLEKIVHVESQSESISNEVSNVSEIRNDNIFTINSDNDSDSLVIHGCIDGDNIKVEIDENHAGSEIIENDINNAIERTLQSSGIDPSTESEGTGDDVPPIYLEPVPACEDVNDIVMLENDKTTAEDQKSNMLSNNEEIVTCSMNETKNVLNDIITMVNQEISGPTHNKKLVNHSVNENNSIITDSDKTTNVMDIDNNANETFVISKHNSENNRTATDNEGVHSAVVYAVDSSGVIRIVEKDETDVENTNAANSDTVENNTKDPDSAANDSLERYDVEKKHYDGKINKLIQRNSKAGQRSNLEGLQDFYHKQVVTINGPDEKYLPRNIFLHKTAYVLNMDIVRNQNSTNANVSSDENDLNEVPNRISRSTDQPSFANLPRFVSNPPVNVNAQPRYPVYRPFWNPRHNYNMYYSYNVFRPSMQNYFTHPGYRYQAHPYSRQQSMVFNENTPNVSGNNQAESKRIEAMKTYHYNTIMQIATRFKSTVCTSSQARSLNNILTIYNSRYGARLELTRDFDIIDRNVQAVVVDVIDLDDDAESKRNKPHRNDDGKIIDKNLERLKVLAAKLKDLQMKNLASSRHRRVFSNAIKTFNKSFNADIYLDSNFDIKDRRLVILDSSSDSDTVVAVEKDKVVKKRKKLRNPFSVLKRSKNVDVGASTSREDPIPQTLFNNSARTSQNVTCDNNINTASPISDRSSKGLMKYFHKAWLPSDEDFGRAELCSRETARLDALLYEAEYLQVILKESVAVFNSWLDLKIAVLKDIQRGLDIQKQQAEALSNDFLMETESQFQPIVGPDCTDLRSTLKQLAIIKTNKEIPTETSLRIHFDVWNRDTHYKKTNPPKPHFRLICLDESAKFPSSEDVVALQSRYDDDVPTVFAFIGTGSISYLQINPIDLPVFIPDNDLA